MSSQSELNMVSIGKSQLVRGVQRNRLFLILLSIVNLVTWPIVLVTLGPLGEIGIVFTVLISLAVLFQALRTNPYDTSRYSTIENYARRMSAFVMFGGLFLVGAAGWQWGICVPLIIPYFVLAGIISLAEDTRNKIEQSTQEETVS